MSLRIVMRDTSPQGKEACIEYIKSVGKYIEEHAELLLGDISHTKNVRISFNIGVDEVPTITVKKEKLLDLDEGYQE